MHLTKKRYSLILQLSDPKKKLLVMEREVLHTLGFRLFIPTVKSFVDVLLRVCSADVNTAYLTRFLYHLCVYDHRFGFFLPSEVALSCICLSLFTRNLSYWVFVFALSNNIEAVSGILHLHEDRIRKPEYPKVYGYALRKICFSLSRFRSPCSHG
jgi:hypothetical protein